MPLLQVKELDEEVLRTFKARAARDGKSLQSYMHDLLTDLASRPSRAELLQKLDQQAAVSPADNVTTENVLEALRESRERR